MPSIPSHRRSALAAAALLALAACGPAPVGAGDDEALAKASAEAKARANEDRRAKAALNTGAETVVYGLPRVIADLERAKGTRAATLAALESLSAEEFFRRLADSLAAHPPPTADAPMLQTIRAIGVVPGEKYDVAKLDPAVARGLATSVTVALAKLDAAAKGTPWPPGASAEYAPRAVAALARLRQ
jgi:hypothetical protein